MISERGSFWSLLKKGLGILISSLFVIGGVAVCGFIARGFIPLEEKSSVADSLQLQLEANAIIMQQEVEAARQREQIIYLLDQINQKIESFPPEGDEGSYYDDFEESDFKVKI